MKFFACSFILFLAISTLKAQNKLDTIFTESYTGFLEGELGDCIHFSEYCDEENTVIFPIGAPLQFIKDLRYKRIFADSTHTRIAREYIKGEDSVFLYASYHPATGKMLEYGGLYLKYNPIVYSTLEENKSILAVQAIEIQKMGFWQESLNIGLKAGYYVNNEPIASWKYFSLPFFMDLNLVSEIWTYDKGQIINRDTINLVEKQITDKQAMDVFVSKTWYLKGENKNIAYLQTNAHQYPYEAWSFSSNGSFIISMHTNKELSKIYSGNWRWESPLKIQIIVPEFANLTLDLRYLTDNKMLFLK